MSLEARDLASCVRCAYVAWTLGSFGLSQEQCQTTPNPVFVKGFLNKVLSLVLLALWQVKVGLTTRVFRVNTAMVPKPPLLTRSQCLRVRRSGGLISNVELPTGMQDRTKSVSQHGSSMSGQSGLVKISYVPGNFTWVAELFDRACMRRFKARMARLAELFAGMMMETTLQPHGLVRPSPWRAPLMLLGRA